VTRDPAIEALAAEIERTRARTLRPPRMRPLGNEFARTAADLKRDRRRFAVVAEAWAAHCPGTLASRSTILRFARGVLTIAADDSAMRFELDRWLRSGGEDAVIAASRAPVHRVKVVAGTP